MAEEKKRTIKLFCPSLSKLVPVVAWEDQRLDLGSIARTFGIEPATLKLNGHFISRGVDLISSSVTWKSLLSFFSARGFSTGASDSDALIVDGKLSKLNSKRTFDCINQISQLNGLCLKRKLGLEGSSPVKRTRMNASNSDLTQSGHIFTTKRDRQLRCSLVSNEAKRMREEEMVVASPLKRIRN